MHFWRRKRDFFWFYVTKPVKSVNSRDWTGLLTQRIDPDHFILWHPSVIAGTESTIAGAELSIGGPRATPKVYKLTPMWEVTICNSEMLQRRLALWLAWLCVTF